MATWKPSGYAGFDLAKAKAQMRPGMSNGYGVPKAPGLPKAAPKAPMPKAFAPPKKEDFDWGRVLWDESAERTIFAVAPSNGTSLRSTATAQRQKLAVGTQVYLALGAQPQKVDADGTRWVRVCILSDSGDAGAAAVAPAGMTAAAAGAAAPGSQESWWARWADLELVPGEVASAAHEEAKIDTMIEKTEKTSWQEKVNNKDWVKAYWHRQGQDVSMDKKQAQKASPQDLMLRAYVRQVQHVKQTRDVYEPETVTGPDQDPAADEGWARCPIARAISPHAVRGRVSVVCPTYPRRHKYHEALYRIFCAQTWPDKELIVLDTGGEVSPFFTQRRGSKPPVDDPRVLYVHSADYPLTLGHKRNQLVQMSSGEIIAHCDDDNLYASEYLSMMVQHLRASEAQMVRVSSAFSWDPKPDFFAWHSGIECRAESFMHLRAPLNALAFNHVNVGEEHGMGSTCVVHDVDDEYGVFVHVTHGGNVSSYEHKDSEVHKVRAVDIRQIPNSNMRRLVEQHRRFYLD